MATTSPLVRLACLLLPIVASCQQAPADELPPDAALLGRWEAAPYPGQMRQPHQSLEFTADGSLRIFRNDTLSETRTYQCRRPSREIEASPAERFLSLSGSVIDKAYQITNDTLHWQAPQYKNIINCFPYKQRFARTRPQGPQ